MLTFRKATKEDTALYFEWANDLTVRENSINKSQIIFEDHVTWFSGRLNNPASILLVFENDSTAIGQLRIEIDDLLGEAFINYSIDKSYRGKGLGSVILSEGRKYYSAHGIPYPLVGFVKPGNAASIAAFHKAGFIELQGEFTINKETYLKFTDN